MNEPLREPTMSELCMVINELHTSIDQERALREKAEGYEKYWQEQHEEQRKGRVEDVIRLEKELTTERALLCDLQNKVDNFDVNWEQQQLLLKNERALRVQSERAVELEQQSRTSLLNQLTASTLERERMRSFLSSLRYNQCILTNEKDSIRQLLASTSTSTIFEDMGRIYNDLYNKLRRIQGCYMAIDHGESVALLFTAIMESNIDESVTLASKYSFGRKGGEK